MKNRESIKFIGGACMLVGCAGFIVRGDFISGGLFGVLAAVFFISAFKKNNS